LKASADASIAAPLSEILSGRTKQWINLACNRRFVVEANLTIQDRNTLIEKPVNISVSVSVGDVLDESADVLICPANPWLNLSGGVNGAILMRGGEKIQTELHKYLLDVGQIALEPAAVVVSNPGPLSFKHILHAIAIDAFYDSSIDLVKRTLESAFTMAKNLDAKTIALPALATGYGHLSMEEFAKAFADTVKAEWPQLERVSIVLRSSENEKIVRESLLLHGIEILPDESVALRSRIT
jgi:O-acetyl-ADP-ribose deacetylase